MTLRETNRNGFLSKRERRERGQRKKPSALTYDSAGNLTADKDGYEYQYDYENRIVKITKDDNDIAEFAYDALGRRIEKNTLT